LRYCLIALLKFQVSTSYLRFIVDFSGGETNRKRKTGLFFRLFYVNVFILLVIVES